MPITLPVRTGPPPELDCVHNYAVSAAEQVLTADQAQRAGFDPAHEYRCRQCPLCSRLVVWRVR